MRAEGYTLKDLGIEWRDSLLNDKDSSGIKKVIQKAENGEKIVIGFLGGSITQGCLSSTPFSCYAYLVYRWWADRFGEDNVKYVNAGIGGTTSQFGAARVQEDILDYAADLIIVEFSVNDDDNGHFMETYEGLIRKLYGDKNKPALLIVSSVRYDNGQNAQNIHLKIAKHYEIPLLSMKSSIYRKIEDKTIKSRDITEDDLHPNDTGHALMAEIINSYLQAVSDSISDDYDECIRAEGYSMPKPLTANRYEHSVRYRNDNCAGVLIENRGFAADDEPQKDIRDIFRRGFFANSKGAYLCFRAEGSAIAVQYRKSISRPAPVARVVIDNDYDNAVIIDGNFDEDWGDCLYIDTIAEYSESRVHNVEIEIIQGTNSTQTPFYLVSLISSDGK